MAPRLLRTFGFTVRREPLTPNDSRCKITYGFRFAPFLQARLGIWRKLRCVLAAPYIEFPDVGEHLAVELPVFPYIYWQWPG